MSYDNFKGSNYLYSFWNDMNEPSVFSGGTMTLPLETLHYKRDGTKVEHRSIHNAYGGLQQKASYNGLLMRDNYTRRPFVLTRSFFIGSQKYGAYWTGDNNAINEELAGCMEMIMICGLSGHPFGGADVPGFYGNPSEEVYIMFY